METYISIIKLYNINLILTKLVEQFNLWYNYFEGVDKVKRLIKFIFGLIGSILLFIIITVVAVAILLYDSTNNMNQDIIDADKPATEVIQDATFDALETTVSENKLSFGFTEYSMNELLYGLTKDVVEKIDVLKIKGIYTKYNDDGTFTLHAPLKLYSFKSKLSAKINVIDTDDSITLELSNVKLQNNIIS